MVRFYTFVVVVAASCVHHKCKRKMLRRSSASVSGAEAVGTRLQNEKLKKKNKRSFFGHERPMNFGAKMCVSALLIGCVLQIQMLNIAIWAEEKIWMLAMNG